MRNLSKLNNMQQKPLDLFNKKLAAYTASAACFLMHHQEAAAQVVYTDIEPDVILDERLEYASFDIDGNGTIDFAFLNSSFTFFDEFWLSYRIRQDILVGPYTSQNAIAGISNYINTGYGAFISYYPYALSINELIGSPLAWQTAGLQVLVLKTFDEDGEFVGFANSCYWYDPSDIPYILNQYVGIRFSDDIENTHYGWIRCDVIDAGRTLIIKDYAYEVQPDSPIRAGDTTHYIGLSDTTDAFNAIIYSFGLNIYINHNDNEMVNATVYDIKGELVLAINLVENYTIINMDDFSKGAYIVRLQDQNNQTLSKLILLQ